MKQSRNRFGWFIVASLGMVGIFCSTHLANAGVNSETRKAATLTGAAAVAEISFSKKSADLSDSAKKELQQVIADSRKSGEIKKVSVAAWADQEYPRKGAGLADTQIDLAKKRAESIQAYLEKSLNVTGVDTVNMAERPSGMQNAFSTADSKTKNTLENSGAAPTGSDQTGLFGLKGKASEAVVMIYHK